MHGDASVLGIGPLRFACFRAHGRRSAHRNHLALPQPLILEGAERLRDVAKVTLPDGSVGEVTAKAGCGLGISCHLLLSILQQDLQEAPGIQE